MAHKPFAFAELASSPLIIDATYKGGNAKNASDDPIAKLIPVGNSGGIRYRGLRTSPAIVALLLSGGEIDWPDRFDPETGVLTYFGDNRAGGRELHQTPRGGNAVLRNLFDGAQGGPSSRHRVAPVFVFTKAESGRDYTFTGLAVPSGLGNSADDLVGIWRTRDGVRFQNYRATFTILDAPAIAREWIADLVAGESASVHAPTAWNEWQVFGTIRALRAPRTAEHRSRKEQDPTSAEGIRVVQSIYDHFRGRPHDFEHMAAFLVRQFLPDTSELEVTRKSRDGGRDAVGLYNVGRGPAHITLDFSMEAKCYAPGNSVGVRELSRLISRLRHRQFGVLVTTSHLDLQAYRELKEDRHPIVVLAGREIAEIVRAAGLPTGAAWKVWLDEKYPQKIG